MTIRQAKKDKGSGASSGAYDVIYRGTLAQIKSVKATLFLANITRFLHFGAPEGQPCPLHPEAITANAKRVT